MSSPLDHRGLHAGFATTLLSFAPGLPMAGDGTRMDGLSALTTRWRRGARWLQAGELAVALVSVDLVAVDGPRWPPCANASRISCPPMV